MPTLLVTSKMNPALRARVEKAVAGGRVTSKRTMRLVIALSRVTMVLTVVFGVRAVLANRKAEGDELERLRRELVENVEARAKLVEPADRDAAARATSWVTKVASPEFTEVIADELRAPDALKTRLGESVVWIRGPLSEMARPDKLGEVARANDKDALLYCLIDPPATRTEKTVLEKVRIASSRGPAFDERTAGTYRLHDVIVGLPFLQAPWLERARKVADRDEAVRLRREWDRAPLDRAIVAAQAHLLLVAVDEEGDRPGPTELDGERSHIVRVALIDVAHGGKMLLGVRRRVDPSWISEARRPTQAGALDSCALAFDIHETLRKK